MSSVDLHGASGAQPHRNPPPKHQHDITLTAKLDGDTITVSGIGERDVPVDQDETHFKFTLDDHTGANVKFASLDAADHLTGCPPTGSGNRSSQIFGVTIKNDRGKQPTAGFTDRNAHPAHHGTMNVSYQWNFTCDAPFTVLPFDPIISNGGRN